MTPRSTCEPARSTAARSPRAGVRGARSRELIAATTRTLLLERGYRHLNFDAVAARAGVAKTTVYRWWPARADLVLDLLEHEFRSEGLPLETAARLQVIFAGFPGLARVIAALAIDIEGDTTRQVRLHDLFLDLLAGPVPSRHGLQTSRDIEQYCGSQLFQALIAPAQEDMETTVVR